MMNVKQRCLAGAVGFAMTAAAYAGTAQAAVVTFYGTGSSLVAPYLREAGDCYGNQTQLIFTGPVTQTLPYFNYTGAPSFDCDPANPHAAAAAGPVNSNVTVVYMSTGSGTGIKDAYGHTTLYAGDSNPGTAGVQFLNSPNGGTSPGPVQYGLSETSLDATDVAGWNNGIGTYAGDNLCNDGSAGHTPNTTGHVGLCVASFGGSPPAGSNGINNPRERYGHLIQVPFLVAPVTISYDPVYKRVRNGGGGVTEYSFRLRGNLARADGSGGLHLDADTYCKIFNGVITNWNDPALTALNGGTLLRATNDPTPAGSWSVPIVIVGRSDSSGTTSLWTRHLANVCAAVGGNQYATATTTLPATLRNGNAVYDKVTDTVSGTITTGSYVTANGSDGVAQYVDFRSSHQPGPTAGDSVLWGRMGYVGPDFVLPYVTSTGANTFGLNTATLQNSSGKFIAPSPASALAAAATVTPPDSFANGKYDAGSADTRDRANPQDWVEPASPTSPLANPADVKAYPIVGTANLLLYTCYSTSGLTKAIAGQNRAQGFLDWYYSDASVNDASAGLLGKAGFATMPKAFRTAIAETFLDNKDKVGLGLQISTVGSGACTNGEIGG